MKREDEYYLVWNLGQLTLFHLKRKGLKASGAHKSF